MSWAASATTTAIVGLERVPSYTGELPVWRRALDLSLNPHVAIFQAMPSSKAVRSWVREAAIYHDVPHVLLALVLQEENKPNVPEWILAGQYGERRVQAFGALLEAHGFPVWDKISGGSAGIINMKRETFRKTDDYITSTYKRPVAPDSVKPLPRLLAPDIYTKSDGIKLPFVEVNIFDYDLRIPGQDMRVDLYYMAGRLRQIIDTKKGGGSPYSGPLTVDDIRTIAAAYNGDGPDAAEYGRKSADRLTRVLAGTEPLYFYAEAGAEP